MKYWTPSQIRKLRDAYNESQSEFAARIRCNTDTVRNWETGRARPSGPIQLLLDRLQEDLDAGGKRPHPSLSLSVVG